MQQNYDLSIAHARNAIAAQDGGIIHFNINYLPVVSATLKRIITKVHTEHIRPYGAIDVQPKVMACVLLVESLLANDAIDVARDSFVQMQDLVTLFPTANSWYLLACVAELLRVEAGVFFEKAREAYALDDE